MGIEPTLRAWEAPVLPLNYTRLVCTHYMFFQDKRNVIDTLFCSPPVRLPTI